MVVMNDEKENGDDGNWMNEEDQNASKPLMDSNCFHVDVQKWGHHEKTGVLEKRSSWCKNGKLP